uniref:Alpha-1,3-glucosyltransferase n=1 Tax=Eutreptiella gymnastica TaxID=73025 RepID=A0A7S1J2K8_9EUGL|mmetsp:Transcript_60704/g.108276  ORF Transcript_60704/g.108276 Transcript_60704/m.108276 type:complete len:537 (+) Transcript_60704:59-1669(+)
MAARQESESAGALPAHVASGWSLPATVLIVLTSLLVRCAVGFHPHSGQSKPPMYGDYEAQRHWMELTVNLPIAQWYNQTAKNDLQYWGLDYPPLTAFHSWVCGKVGEKLLPSAFALRSSRGHETAESKMYMRATVLVADLIVYIPSCILVLRALTRSRGAPQSILAEGKGLWPTFVANALILLLALHPGLLIIDHGHFQFNGVSIGLSFLAVACLSHKRHLLGSIFFCLALNYKQMLLYYSPVFFFYLLAASMQNVSFLRGLLHVAVIGIVVVGTFGVCWLPWLLDGRGTTLQVVHRLFPFDRGLFEDKVANFWCSLSLVYKAHKLHSRAELQMASTVLTLVGFMPCSVHLLRRPSMASFVYSLVITALSFFQFSFHVHEKTILLAVVPACLLLAFLVDPGAKKSSWTGHQKCLLLVTGQFNLIALFSMYPLLLKDGLVVVYVALMAVSVSLFYTVLRKVATGLEVTLSMLSSLGMVGIHIAAAVVTPPAKYPDIITMAFTVYAFGHFFLAYLVYNVLQWRFLGRAGVEDAKKKTR